MDFNSLDELWNAICNDCKNEITQVGFDTWIAPLAPVSVSGGFLTLKINNEYKKSIIVDNYLDKLEKSCRNISGLDLKIQIIVTNQEKEEQKEMNLSVPGNLNDLYTFDNFIVGSSNRFAHAAAIAVAENPAVAYNPLFIYGNSGVGKTHLMLAIKNHINKKFPDKKVEFVRCEEFTNSLISSLHNGTVSLFHQRFRSIDVLLMDDIQFIAGKESTQEEFFNTFNALYQENKQIVITSDRPPKEIQPLDERIKTRFESGLLADIEPPDFETRVGILHNKSKNIDLQINDDLTYYIAEQITMNTRQLEGVVKKLKAYKNLHSNDLSLAVVQNFIRDIINDSIPEPITVERVVNEVSRTFGVSVEDIFSKRKSSNIVVARQAAIYILRETTQLSYMAIGKSFGKDHTTILYTIKKMEDNILKNNLTQKKLIEDIIKNLKND
ncbi:MAG: chromosomal replication initiator protein DnaA [bacterium]|nr:chromosomal replication initiator protein DnaA [bacterium]